MPGRRAIDRQAKPGTNAERRDQGRSDRPRQAQLMLALPVQVSASKCKQCELTVVVGVAEAVIAGRLLRLRHWRWDVGRVDNDGERAGAAGSRAGGGERRNGKVEAHGGVGCCGAVGKQWPVGQALGLCAFFVKSKAETDWLPCFLVCGAVGGC